MSQRYGHVGRGDAEVKKAKEKLGLRSQLPRPKMFHQRQDGSVGGTGCFASLATGIKAGQRILVEYPLFDMPPDFQDQDLDDELRSLSQADRQAFLSLHAVNGTTPLNRRIFETNRVQMLEGEQEEPNTVYRDAVFLQASRFNHSCVHNAYMQWNEKKGQLTIYAVKRIPNGEEILVNYIELWFFRQNDRSIALRHYGFLCRCEACRIEEPFGLESENRRTNMRTLETAIKNAATNVESSIHSRHSVADMEELLDSLDLEGLIFPVVAYLHLQCQEWYCQHYYETEQFERAETRTRYKDNRSLAIKSAREALKHALMATGRDSKVTRRALNAIEDCRQLGDLDWED